MFLKSTKIYFKNREEDEEYCLIIKKMRDLVEAMSVFSDNLQNQYGFTIKVSEVLMPLLERHQ